MDSLLAEYQQRGVRGYVGFLRSPEGAVVAQAVLKGAAPGEVFVWKVFSSPMEPGEPCSEDLYGEE